MKKQEDAKVQEHKDYGTYTVVAFIVPLSGLIIGSIMMAKDDELDKKLGVHLISIGVLSSVFFTLVLMLLTS